MSLFRANSTTKFEGPHQSAKIVQAGADPKDASAAMIMIHGRGASAHSILGLANEFEHREKISFYAPQANGFTWYPYSFMAPTDKNQPGIDSGIQMIYDLIKKIEEEGISKEKVLILGFSQGACLASEFVARHPDNYGGLIALSGGLIGESVSLENYEGSFDKTSVFMGCSDVDPHIPKERVNETEDVLTNLGAEVTKKLYPGMGHMVNEDEITHIQEMINNLIDS